MTAARVVAADTARSDWYRALMKLFESYDFLVLPTAQVFSQPIRIGPLRLGKAMDTYHRWIVVIGERSRIARRQPVGFDSKGRPMGSLWASGADKAVLNLRLPTNRHFVLATANAVADAQAI